MKKAIYAFVMISLFSLSFMPALAADVSTGLTRDTSGGAAPIVKAKWEANGASIGTDGLPVAYTSALEYYRDDAVTAGAQFTPSGKYNVSKTIALCSVVTDPDGLADITTTPGAVYGDVFYPEGTELGNSHVALPSQSGLGCGQLMQEDKLTKLSKADGLSLFCTNVRTNNPNLVTFNTGYTYDEICKLDGELQKETAAVYCTTKDLSYEDPNGIYAVWAVAQDKVGLQGQLENTFTYLPVTAFEADFSSVTYGNVRLATEKIISGDLTWDAMNAGRASVRNVGNTRLAMRVVQDDMGFGMTDSAYNVSYKARVGSGATWSTYAPNAAPRVLADELDLSELDEMDFSITVSKFPPTHDGDSYTGNMTLSAISRPHLVCGTEPTTN